MLASAAACTGDPSGCLCLIWHPSLPAAVPSARASRSPPGVTANACVWKGVFVLLVEQSTLRRTLTKSLPSHSISKSAVANACLELCQELLPGSHKAERCASL